MKTNYDQKEIEKQEYSKTNESVEKLIKKVLEIYQDCMTL